jgi:polyhydroxybutyrate depolymerase
MRIVLVMFVVACSSPGQDTGVDASAGDSGSGASMIDAAVQTATCEGRTAQPLDASWTLTVGGMQRTARVHVPASYDPTKPTPLVINVHGLTSYADQQAQLSHAIAKSDAAGFIVIHPEGTGTPRSWNAGACCAPASTEGVDDLGFTSALVDEAAARLCVDPARIYLMGLSNGGHMAYAAACRLADTFAAVASVAGTLQESPCEPSRPVPLLQVHGNADLIVGYAGGESSVATWKAKNGCTSSATTYDHGAASCVTHTGCTAGADVVFCSIAGGGHQWPGGDALPFLGTKSDDLIATDAIWDFFVAHPK